MRAGATGACGSSTLQKEYNRLNETITKLRTRPNEAIKELGLHGEEFWQASLEEGKARPRPRGKADRRKPESRAGGHKKAQQGGWRRNDKPRCKRKQGKPKSAFGHGG